MGACAIRDSRTTGWWVTLTHQIHGKDHHERKSILWRSGRGREIRRGFRLGARHRDLLHQQPLDPVGDHPRHPGLALRDLRGAVRVIGRSPDERSDIRDNSNTAPDIALMSFVKWFEREMSPPCDFRWS